MRAAAASRALATPNGSAVTNAFAAAVAKSAHTKPTWPSAPPSPQPSTEPDSAVVSTPSSTIEGVVDELPRVYDKASIERYWSTRQLEVASRWAEFVRLSVPLITRATSEALSGTLRSRPATQRALASDLVEVLEKLGPAFVKAGQSLSIRPDVVGPEVAEILVRLQDAVKPFEQDEAQAVLAEELATTGHTIAEVFEELPMTVSC